MQNTYDPFTYNPMIGRWFTDAQPLPDSAQQLATARPDLAQHLNSIWSFVGWLQNSSPELYDAITNYNPQLLDPVTVVASGSLSPNPISGKAVDSKLNGMADTTTDSSSSSLATTLTDWGTNLVNTISAVAPSYFQAKSQSDLMNINIQRAAQGLPPIDSSTLAPTVNVGISKDVQTLGIVAIGGLVLVGLLAAFHAKRR